MIKEYVNFSFYGIWTSKNSIHVDMELDLSESTGTVPLITEAFSHFFINLCNNAFDAMREKMTGDGRRRTDEAYKPKLTVRTKAENGTVVVEIEDNGQGIPEEMKDKIMQPFFTTKKGTEGTGLGFSITNDIIRAHGVIIEINSSENGTIMALILNKKPLMGN